MREFLIKPEIFTTIRLLLAFETLACLHIQPSWSHSSEPPDEYSRLPLSKLRKAAF